MIKIRENEIEKFVKESIEVLLDNLDKGYKLVVVCTPSCDYEGDFTGLNFGFMDDDMFHEVLDMMGHNGIPSKFAVALSITSKNRKMYEYEKNSRIDFLRFEEDEKDEDALIEVMSKEEAEKIYYKEKIEKFNERIEYIKKNVFHVE